LKKNTNTIHVEMLDCPLWLYKILKKFFPYTMGIPNRWEDAVENHIAQNSYKYAKLLIEVIEKYYGASTFSTRLSTRISVIEILGE